MLWYGVVWWCMVCIIAGIVKGGAYYTEREREMYICGDACMYVCMDGWMDGRIAGLFFFFSFERSHGCRVVERMGLDGMRWGSFGVGGGCEGRV